MQMMAGLTLKQSFNSCHRVCFNYFIIQNLHPQEIPLLGDIAAIKLHHNVLRPRRGYHDDTIK